MSCLAADAVTVADSSNDNDDDVVNLEMTVARKGKLFALS